MSKYTFYDMADGPSKENLETLASEYCFLNGKKQEDGSRGEVKISPKQLLDILFQAYLEGYNDH